MAIRRLTSEFGTDLIAAGDIADGAISDSKLSAGTTEADSFNLPGRHVKLPSVTTTQRDELTAAAGMLIYNTTLGMLQQYNIHGWASIDSPPTVSSLNYPGDDTALDTVGEFALASSVTVNTDATITVSSTTALKQGMLVTGAGIPASATVLSITSGTIFELSADANASGTVTLTFNTQTLVIAGTNFQTGLTVTIDGTAPSTVTRNNSTQITVTGTPAKTAGTKLDGLVVTNPSGLGASINVDYSALPGWTSPASGNILEAYTGTITEIALTGGAGTTSYAITTGALPAGLTIGSGDGDINGNMTAAAATYNFTVTATDDQAQSSPRLFNIISKGVGPTGGTITYYGAYVVHTFILSGGATQYFTPGISLNIDYLLVGGGGAGGPHHAGGGGAGGVRTAVSQAVTAQAYTITIGDGSIAGTTAVAGTIGANGEHTEMSAGGFTTVTANGGGRGGGFSTYVPLAGGSGGGGNGTTSSSYSPGADGLDAAVTFGTATNQGNDGGNGGQAHSGGGGGGAAAAGLNAVSGNAAGNGGDGIKTFWGMDAANTTLLLASAGIGAIEADNYRYVAGGGGGGTWGTGPTGAGGYGGGGSGTYALLTGAAVVAESNMGAGGAGGGVNDTYVSPGGGTDPNPLLKGGSGVAIIRYLL